MNLTWSELCKEYQIIGTTLHPTTETLPLRLSPVYQRRDQDDFYYLSDDEDDDSPPNLRVENAGWLREQLGYRLEVPIQPQPEHWLMQFRSGEPPEYLHRAAVSGRLRQAYEEALRSAVVALDRNERSLCRRCLWYAARADPSEPPTEPLPQLALIPLLRETLKAEDLSFYIKDLEREFSKEAIRATLALLAKRADYLPLWALLQKDPALASLEPGVDPEAPRRPPVFLDARPPATNIGQIFPWLRAAWQSPPRPTRVSLSFSRAP